MHVSPFGFNDNIEASVHKCERKVLLLQARQVKAEKVQFTTNSPVIIKLKSLSTTNLGEKNLVDGGTKALLLMKRWQRGKGKSVMIQWQHLAICLLTSCLPLLHQGAWFMRLEKKIDRSIGNRWPSLSRFPIYSLCEELPPGHTGLVQLIF